jgi:uncharacterized membrane protein
MELCTSAHSATHSGIFLRDVEQVTLKIVLGAGLIVIGVLLVTLWKSP